MVQTVQHLRKLLESGCQVRIWESKLLFLMGGILIHKIDNLRPLLEKNGYRFIGSSNLGQAISLIFKQETETIKQ